MKYYFSELFSSLQNFSKRLDDVAVLTNQHWVSLGEIENQKNVYIFLKDKQLLISENGRVKRNRWEYLGNQSLLIEVADEIFLFKHGFIDDNILALKLDGSDQYAIFINETKYNKELNSAQDIFNFLENKYIKKNKLVIDDKPKYFVLENNKEKGPYNLDEIRILLGKNRLNHFSFVREVAENNYAKRIRLKDVLQ